MITSDGTKKCTKCKQVKSVSDFTKDASRRDGVSYTCRQCASGRVRAANAEYQKEYWTKNRDALLAKQRERYANRTEEDRLERNRRAVQYKARHHDEVIQRTREYNARASATRIAYVERYREADPNRYAAAIAVKDAIRSRQLPPAKECVCADCGGQAQHYHHESYAPEHRLDVVPLCASCHKKRHAKPPTGL